MSPASDSRSGRRMRDGAGHRGLVVQVGAVLAGRAVDLRAVLGQQGLVRGDHRLAALERGEQQRPGRLDAADHLDHDVDVGPGRQRVRVRGEQRPVDPGGAPVPDPPHRDPGQLQPGADAQRQVVGLPGEQPGHLGADDAAAEQGYLEYGQGLRGWLDLFHPMSKLSRSSRVSRRMIGRARAAADGDHGRARDVVVVTGQRPAVRAGGRHREQVAGGQVGRQPVVPHHDVAALAVLAHHPGQHRRGHRGAGGERALVGGVVQRGTDVVAHPAVHADAGARSRSTSLIVPTVYSDTVDGPTMPRPGSTVSRGRASPAARHCPSTMSRRLCASSLTSGASSSVV